MRVAAALIALFLSQIFIFGSVLVGYALFGIPIALLGGSDALVNTVSVVVTVLGSGAGIYAALRINRKLEKKWIIDKNPVA